MIAYLQASNSGDAIMKGCIFRNTDDRIEHVFVFLFCPFAGSVWVEVRKVFPLGLSALTNMKQWIFDFLKRGSVLQNTMLGVTFWHISEARNNVKNNNCPEHPHRVTQKINSHQMGLGMIIRDSSGACLFACNELVPGITILEVAEAVVICRALFLAGNEAYSM
uniref:RNase H type-1 domain-containing protein n=1 Tax=Oryza punctata TaxID=4537 RepID=A0A0E0KDT5_ORYPU